jgi:hypothetical protein
MQYVVLRLAPAVFLEIACLQVANNVQPQKARSTETASFVQELIVISVLAT